MTSENSVTSTPVAITVGGLMKEHSRHAKTFSTTLEFASDDSETFSATLEFVSDEPITEIWSRIKGFKAPLYLMSTKSSMRRGWYTPPMCWWISSTKPVPHPYAEVEVVGPDEQSDYANKRISIDDSFIEFANQPYQDQATLKFELESGDLSEGTDTTEKLVINEDLELCFHRTLRMPDDNRLHQLPASLGRFPLFNVEDYGSRLTRFMTERGGIFFPMWQREAMWIGFTSRAHGVYAVRAFVGNVNAISGLPMDEPNDERKDYHFVPPHKRIEGRFVAPDEKQDYIVVPQQKWIDGVCVAPGVVRQFIAMPLGAGYTVEGQITGKEKLGGLKLEIIPAYRLNLKYWSRIPPAGTPDPENFANCKMISEHKTPREEGLKPSDKVRAYPNPQTYPVTLTVSDLLAELPAEGTQVVVVYSPPRGGIRAQLRPYRPLPVGSVMVLKSRVTDIEAMGLAAGGKLIQDIALDRNVPREWNKQKARLINIHILDPSRFEQITHVVSFPPPMDAKAYTDANLPFYVIQEDVDNRLDGGKFDNVLSVSGMDKKVGFTTEPEFDPFKPKMCRQCSIRLCDCIVRPCDHQFCNVCIGKLDDPEGDIGSGLTWKCPTCASEVAHVAGFSAPMNLPGEEVFKANVQVTVLKPHGGSLEFQSIHTTRL